MNKFKMYLPKEIINEHDSINNKYEKMKSKYRPNIDAFIPEDKKLIKQIIKFKIAFIEYMIKNYNQINLAEYQNFLVDYDSQFLYGPDGDDMNYLDSDKYSLNGEELKYFCKDLDEDDNVPKKKLEEIKDKYSQVLLKLG